MKPTRLAGVVWAVLLIGCVSTTVNIYFPEDQIESAADEIERDVRGIDSATSERPAQSAVFPALWQTAHAAVDFDIDTPKIRKIRTSREERFPKVNALLNDGFAGEGNNGYLKERDRAVYASDLKKLSEARKVMAEENKDRREQYIEIARANNIAESDVKQIEEVFAKKIRELLKEGQYYEDDKGEWVKKKK